MTDKEERGGLDPPYLADIFCEQPLNSLPVTGRTLHSTLHTVQYALHLNLHMYTSYSTLSNAHCTPDMYTACCTLIKSWLSSNSIWWRQNEHWCTACCTVHCTVNCTLYCITYCTLYCKQYCILYSCAVLQYAEGDDCEHVWNSLPICRVACREPSFVVSPYTHPSEREWERTQMW